MKSSRDLLWRRQLSQNQLVDLVQTDKLHLLMALSAFHFYVQKLKNRDDQVYHQNTLGRLNIDVYRKINTGFEKFLQDNDLNLSNISISTLGNGPSYYNSEKIEKYGSLETFRHYYALYCGFDGWKDFQKSAPVHEMNNDDFTAIKNYFDSESQKDENENLILNIYDNFLKGGKKNVCYKTLFLFHSNFFKTDRLFGLTDEDEIDKTISTGRTIDKMDKIQNYFAPDDFFPKLEFEKGNVNVKVITSSLEWMLNNISEIVDGANKKNNTYKYILTKNSEEIKERIEEIQTYIRRHLLKKDTLQILQIKNHFITLFYNADSIIKTVEKEYSDEEGHPSFMNLSEKVGKLLTDAPGGSFSLREGSIFVPFDYLIYENINPLDEDNKIFSSFAHTIKSTEDFAGKYRRYFAIQSLNPVHYSNSRQDLKYYDIFFEKAFGEKIRGWFNYVWKLFDEEISKGNRNEYFLIR